MDDDVHRFSSATWSEVIDKLINTLHMHYIFPDVADTIAFKLHQQQSRGDYDMLSEEKRFAEVLTAHVREISNDTHLLISVEPQKIDSEGDTDSSETTQAIGAIFNYGFEKVERLAGNIGYLGLQAFFSPAVAYQAAITSMDFLAHTYALIIDLRNASGGDLAMVKFFASYFFSPDPIHLHDIFWRHTNSMQQCWTLPYIPGRRYATKPVYILTSRTTSAAAEAFVYGLQSQKRATIIGEHTAGEANPLERFCLTPHFACWIPVGRMLNPVTETSWEGIGVQSDVEVPQEHALKIAYTHALKYVLESNVYLHNPAQHALEKEIRAVLGQQS